MVKLQGTAPNQVPTNADLGSLAYVDHDTVNNITAADLRLKALSKTKSATAVDVFIYDTSNDSDGGAWRHRTQHTSWYNEGASSTRGSRKEFPAIAVIVAEEHSITIYDGDDPSLPMWMVFTENLGALGGVITAGMDLTSVAMLNGVLVGGYGNGLSYVNFLSEVLERGFNVNTANVGVMPFNVAERDQNPAGLGGALNLEIVNAVVNDVAMTVLPDAPTDPATGLPVPTIAVATDSGVSVIRDDGTVVDSLQTYVVGNCALNSEGIFYSKDGGTASFSFATFADIAGGDGFGDEVASQSVGTSSFDILTRPTELALLGQNISVGGRVEGTGVVNGVALHAPNYTDFTKGMSALTTSSYNTGWMNGDIKLAALADTTAETLSGSELVVDGSGNWVGDFDVAADVSSWSNDGASTISHNASGYLDIDRNGAFVDAGRRTAEITISGLTVGETYVVSADLIAVSHGFSITVFTSSYGTVLDGDTVNATGPYSLTFVATQTSHVIGLGARQSNDATVTVDNVSARLADPDRSVNGKGLAVHGSITKAAVATGADVVGYSGFSNSNYLEQPYNSDLDFGTGDFCVMGWVEGFRSAYNCFLHRTSDKTSSSGFRFMDNGSGQILVTGYGNSLNGGVYPTNDWFYVCFVRTGGVGYIYLNGILAASGTWAASVTDVDATVAIGGYWTSNLLIAHSPPLALWRISATAPTADQIKYIYDSERPLFQENAKATLYGSSDAVTALAHDPVTDLLHVGTSSGRSVFQGLRRVDNTTTAVSTAISANDSLIVEQ